MSNKVQFTKLSHGEYVKYKKRSTHKNVLFKTVEI